MAYPQDESLKFLYRKAVVDMMSDISMTIDNPVVLSNFAVDLLSGVPDEEKVRIGDLTQSMLNKFEEWPF